jgi:hypothetical protein
MQTDERLSRFTASQLENAHSLEFVGLLRCAAERAKHHTVQLSDEFECLRCCDLFLERRTDLPRDMVRKAVRDYETKAVVNPGTIAEPAWAAPLAVPRPLAAAFVVYLSLSTLIGKLFPSASRMPFNVSIPAQTGGGTYRWIGEGAPKPVGNMQFQSKTLSATKASGIAVLSGELVDKVSPGSDVVVRNELVRGVSAYLDTQLVDPTVAAVANVSPASITNGAPSIGSSGSSAANALTDFKALIASFSVANPNSEAVVLTSPGNAMALAVAANTQTLGPGGGTLYGITVHTGAIGGRVVILDPSALLVADDGGLDVMISRQSAVEFDTLPTSPPTAGSVWVALWQNNLVGFQIDRFINWRMARPNAVVYTNQTYI